MPDFIVQTKRRFLYFYGRRSTSGHTSPDVYKQIDPDKLSWIWCFWRSGDVLVGVYVWTFVCMCIRVRVCVCVCVLGGGVASLDHFSFTMKEKCNIKVIQRKGNVTVCIFYPPEEKIKNIIYRIFSKTFYTNSPTHSTSYSLFIQSVIHLSHHLIFLFIYIQN